MSCYRINLLRATGSARYGKSRRVVHQEATKSGRTRGSKHLRGPRIGENEFAASDCFGREKEESGEGSPSSHTILSLDFTV